MSEDSKLCNRRLSLFEIGTENGTDKAPHAYLPHYEKRFESKRDDLIRLLEIGVMEGNSLRMWRDYFPRGQIYGIDVVPESIIMEERIQCFLGRQEDRTFLRNTVIAVVGNFHFVVDDGGHKGKQHVISYEELWPYVLPGGWYCIEDAFSIFDVCWTQPEERTILDIIQEQWKDILTTKGDIAEVAVLGCDTQKWDGRNNGLICFQKACKEKEENDD